MQVYLGMDPRLPLVDVPAYASRAEATGADGLHVAETIHDALAVSLLALEHTRRITVRTSVALAFVRSPTLTAYAAWDLSRFSGGRFQLGLGTQIRQNIEDRHGMPWLPPVERMRDYVDAVRAAFGAFRDGGPPHHEGTHYRITRMQPYFNPGPDADTVEPPIWLGGVNEGICRLAGGVADGFVTHPTNSNRRYLETVALPSLRAGAAGAGRSLADLELVVTATVVGGRTPEAVAAERERQRRLVAFLYSTPAYRRTLELHGWDDLAPRLQAMVRQDRWDDLGDLVPDELLDTLVPVGSYEELGPILLERFADLADGIVLPPLRAVEDDAEVAGLVRALQAGGRA